MCRNKLLLFTAYLGLGLSSGAVQAAQVDFNIGQSEGTFHCLAIGEGILKIDSHNLDGQGFDCDTSHKGHFQLTVEEINKYFFRIKKPTYRTGNVTINFAAQGKGQVTCSQGSGTSRTEYKPGAQYCLIKPE